MLNEIHQENKVNRGHTEIYSDFGYICKKKGEQNKVGKEEANNYHDHHFYPVMRREMKKIILVSILSLCIIGLMGCTKKQSQQGLQTDTTTNSSCKETIAAYLQQAKTISKGEEVKKGATITVDYVGRLDAETVFDTSVESIAKACGKYNSGRNYNEGLSFTVGAGQMIAGFDQGVEGMKVGETKTIEIAAKEAYGERDESKLITMTKDQIPDADKFQAGMKVASAYGQTFTVYKVTDKDIIFDANHELAGKTLIFDITVKSIKK